MLNIPPLCGGGVCVTVLPLHWSHSMPHLTLMVACRMSKPVPGRRNASGADTQTDSPGDTMSLSCYTAVCRGTHNIALAP